MRTLIALIVALLVATAPRPVMAYVVMVSTNRIYLLLIIADEDGQKSIEALAAPDSSSADRSPPSLEAIRRPTF